MPTRQEVHQRARLNARFRRKSKRVRRDMRAAKGAELESPAIVVGDVVFKQIPPIPTLERVVEQALAARRGGDAR
jgi:hypothetical protein